MSLRRVVFADRSEVVFRVPPSATTRAQVQRVGIPLYVCPPGRRWRVWRESAERVSRRTCEAVPLADADPPHGEQPGAFVVGATRWCAWPLDARQELLRIAPWTKAPGVMQTGALGASEAERVRSLCVRLGLDGLEEFTLNDERAADVE